MNEREIKKNLKILLSEDDLDNLIRETTHYPLNKTISILMGELYSIQERRKWHAVTLMGILMDRNAQENLESARIIMRRILWNLNEESGGIGWGMAEAMGEILAVNPTLAKEYSNMLVSYMREENYLEHPVQQQGLMWAIGRLAKVRPELLIKYNADGYMSIYLESPDPRVAGLACRNFGILGIKEAIPQIEKFIQVDIPINIYEEGHLSSTTVGSIARKALENLRPTSTT